MLNVLIRVPAADQEKEGYAIRRRSARHVKRVQSVEDDTAACLVLFGNHINFTRKKYPQTATLKGLTRFLPARRNFLVSIGLASTRLHCRR